MTLVMGPWVELSTNGATEMNQEEAKKSDKEQKRSCRVTEMMIRTMRENKKTTKERKIL